MIVKACHCGRPAIPGTTRCPNHPRRWQGGSTRAWRKQRERILQRDPFCFCGKPSVEVHHRVPGSALNLPDSCLIGVCHQHNPRGG